MKPSEVEKWDRLQDPHIQNALQDIETRPNDSAQDIQAQTNYWWESRAEMDHGEKISTRQSIQQSVMIGDTGVAEKKRLYQLLPPPYCGRFQFVRAGQAQADAIDVGVHPFYEERDKKDLVHDWHAAISTMFNDQETGPARTHRPRERSGARGC